MKKCGGLAKYLSEYLEHTLDAKTCEKISSHRRKCKPCAAFLASFEATVKTLRHAPSAHPSAKARRRLRKFIAGL